MEHYRFQLQLADATPLEIAEGVFRSMIAQVMVTLELTLPDRIARLRIDRGTRVEPSEVEELAADAFYHYLAIFPDGSPFRRELERFREEVLPRFVHQMLDVSNRTVADVLRIRDVAARSH